MKYGVPSCVSFFVHLRIPQSPLVEVLGTLLFKSEQRLTKTFKGGGATRQMFEKGVPKGFFACHERTTLFGSRQKSFWFHEKPSVEWSPKEFYLGPERILLWRQWNNPFRWQIAPFYLSVGLYCSGGSVVFCNKINDKKNQKYYETDPLLAHICKQAK